MQQRKGGVTARKGESAPKVNVCLPDRYAAEEVRAVAEYEAARRACSLSQALIDIVLEEADVEGYPEELRERIAELEEAIRLESAARALGGDE